MANPLRNCKRFLCRNLAAALLFNRLLVFAKSLNIFLVENYAAAISREFDSARPNDFPIALQNPWIDSVASHNFVVSSALTLVAN